MHVRTLGQLECHVSAGQSGRPEQSSRVGGQFNYFNARTTLQPLLITCILPSFKFVSVGCTLLTWRSVNNSQKITSKQKLFTRKPVLNFLSDLVQFKDAVNSHLMVTTPWPLRYNIRLNFPFAYYKQRVLSRQGTR